MLSARSSASRDLVLLIAGPTTGTIAVRMGSLAAAMLTNALANLASLGLHNTLALSTHLHLADSAHPAYPNNNVCLSELRPRGVCCGYSGVGMRLVNAPGSPGRKWGLSETHPYMLFLQRWWLAGQASIRGYNLLSLDTDLHLTVHPLRLLRSPPYAPFQLMLQLDSGWPSEADEEGQRSTDQRGQHENLVQCPRNPRLPMAAGPLAALAAATAPSVGPAGSAAAVRGEAAGRAALIACGCGPTPAPLLNTGFVWVRGGAAATPQWRLFNLTVDKILARMATGVPVQDRKGRVDVHSVWAQVGWRIRKRWG